MIICDKDQIHCGPVLWVFELIKKSYGIDLQTENSRKISVGTDKGSDIIISSSFYDSLILKKKFDFEYYFSDAPLVRLDNGSADYVSSIFYLVNGFQEYDVGEEKQDKYGRLAFKSSLQHRYGCLEENLVERYIQELLFQIDSSLVLPQKQSRIFLSHDIDSVFGALKYDGLWALKTGNISTMLRLITQTVLSNPPWFNIDKIADLENAHDVKACYYWILQNGRSEDGIKNGDYSFSNRKIQAQLNHAAQKGNEMGIHKSTMHTGFDEELSSLRGAESNRYHFLKVRNPESYKAMERAGLKSDSSIGFPYHMGFKNSFGLPYYPFDMDSNRNFNILEIPLQIMDGMFGIKDEQSCEEAYERITGFIDANAYNTIISLLWHNSEMTNFAYKWSFRCYQQILEYIVARSFETVLPSQLVNEYQKA